MVEEKENITNLGGKKTKQVMVRVSKYTVERIDDYAGDTHSSRPDFITDSVRQYITYILSEASSVILQIEGLDVSKEAKEAYYTEKMSEKLYPDLDSYRKSREGTSKVQDVSILISMPIGLQKTISEVVDAVGLFSGSQEFIKVAVHYMFRQMSNCGHMMEVIEGFQSMPDGRKALEEELRQIREQLNDERF